MSPRCESGAIRGRPASDLAMTTPCVVSAPSRRASAVVRGTSRIASIVPRRTSPYLLQVVHDLARQIAGDGEPDALIAAALREDRGVDADQLAVGVDQRAARVARIDRGVGLNERCRTDLMFVVGSIERRDDAERHGLAQLIRVADREHPFRDLEFVGVAPRHRRQVPGLDFQERQVGALIRPR